MPWASFDRFDICEAYYQLEADYNVGGILAERPSCERRRESVGVQLHRMQFRPRPSLSFETLTENGRAIYLAAVRRLNLPEPETDGDAYIYCADLHCATCAERIKRDLIAPPDADDESSYDSDDYPKGPYPDGGGAADCPQHCGTCGVFLRNPLTSEGERYARELISRDVAAGRSDSVAVNVWAPFYDIPTGPDADDGSEDSETEPGQADEPTVI